MLQNVYVPDPEKSYIELEYYINGTLKRYVDQRRASITDVFLKRWSRQMIESAVFIHAMGFRHSDIRLDQWLLDADLNARLSDFNGSGYDGQAALGLDGSKALGNESPSHYMPRDPAADSTFGFEQRELIDSCKREVIVSVVADNES